VLHVHVDSASIKFIQHLQKPFSFGFVPFRPAYPADVIVLLIRGLMCVAVKQKGAVNISILLFASRGFSG
jgi:hypothetical protein